MSEGAPGEKKTLLRGEKITKIFLVGAGVRALDDISLEVRQGEFLLITGPSGCGKTTLLSLLGGLDRPTYGEVKLNDHCYSELTEDGLAELRRTEIGFVFQFFNLLGDLTAEENVQLPMRLLGMSPGEMGERSRDLLAGVGLADRAEHYPHELSGGEQQRVAAARALANDPRVVLADEPTGNLDSRNSHELMRLFARLNRERGQTFVVVSHDEMAFDYASRVVYMRDGQVQRMEEAQ